MSHIVVAWNWIRTWVKRVMFSWQAVLHCLIKSCKFFPFWFFLRQLLETFRSFRCFWCSLYATLTSLNQLSTVCFQCSQCYNCFINLMDFQSEQDFCFLRVDDKRSIVIGSCTWASPLQLIPLNVISPSCDLFDVFMDIYHGKFTSGNVGHNHKIQFPVVKGQFTTVKVSRLTAPYVN